ncbi:MAG: UDP-N-acetylmuramyl-tripeptide synthetase [Chloroflexi bacterium]|nr:UDP-N-acetylmuramyl-tripeptide synthetase [Chloroflexota bacterium]
MMATIASLVAAAEPREPRDLGDLVERLRQIDPAARLQLPPGASASTGAATGPEIRGVTSDSRQAVPGSLFVAVPGFHVDGASFAAQAVESGAGAVMAERPLPELGVPQVVVTDARRSLAEAAAWWYGDPSRSLGVIGVTGTDGKTTTSFLAEAALAAAGLRTGLLGTVATQIGGLRERNAAHATTPEAPWLQAVLRAMVAAGDAAAIIETTSHGLALDRVAAIAYDVAVFTNLTHEHLELHGTFEAYRAAKLRLFEGLAVGAGNAAKPAVAWPRTGIVNADDPSAAFFEGATRAAGAGSITFGRHPDADVRLLDVVDDQGRLLVQYRAQGREQAIRLRLAGRFNAHNALAVVAIGLALELDEAAVRAGLESAAAVPGRMERVEAGQPFAVVIDYAHTPASLGGRPSSEPARATWSCWRARATRRRSSMRTRPSHGTNWAKLGPPSRTWAGAPDPAVDCDRWSLPEPPPKRPRTIASRPARAGAAAAP